MASVEFTINGDLRTITIPDSRPLGVESDQDVNHIYFRMPRYYGEEDLADFGIRINYMNAGGEGDAYAVQDKNVQESEIIFSWLVSRKCCKYKGTVRFIVCLKQVDSEGVVTKEYNTTVHSLRVLEGLETIETIPQQYPDIIEQILQKIDRDWTIDPILDRTSNRPVQNKAIKAAVDELSNRIESIEQGGGTAGKDGEDATLLRIDSSRGVLFKNNYFSTTLTVTIYKGSETIADASTMRSIYGQGAYLQWYCRKFDDEFWHTLSIDDSHITQEGFCLTITPDDVDEKIVFKCDLIVD